MSEILDFVNLLYNGSSFAERIATIFWVVFAFLYVIIYRYEKAHGMLRPRDLKKVNYHGTLYIFGLIPAILHYGSQHAEWSFLVPITEHRFNALFMAGLVFLVVGLYLVSAARISLNGYWGLHIFDYAKDSSTNGKGKLITDGIYRHCRHPVYAGQLSMTIGTMMLCNNWWFALFPLGTLILCLLRAWREDNELGKRFPAEFEEYRNRTSFIIPWLK